MSTEIKFYDHIIHIESKKWEFTNLKTSLDHEDGIFGYGHVIKAKITVRETGKYLYLFIGANSMFDILMNEVYDDKVWIDGRVKGSFNDYKIMMNESFEKITLNTSGLFLDTIFMISQHASFTPNGVYWLNITKSRWRALNLLQCIGPYKDNIPTKPIPETVFGVALINLASFNFFVTMKTLDRNVLMYSKILKIIARLVSKNNHVLSRFIKKNLTAISATLMVTTQVFTSDHPLPSSDIDDLLLNYRENLLYRGLTVYPDHYSHCVDNISTLHYLLQSITLRADIVEKLFITEHKDQSVLDVVKNEEVEAVYRIVSAAIYFCGTIASYHTDTLSGQYAFALNLVELALHLFGGFFGPLGVSSLLKYNEYCISNSCAFFSDLFEPSEGHVFDCLFDPLETTYFTLNDYGEENFYEKYLKYQLDFISHYKILEKLQAANNIPEEILLSSILRSNNNKPDLKETTNFMLNKVKRVISELYVLFEPKKSATKNKPSLTPADPILPIRRKNISKRITTKNLSFELKPSRILWSSESLSTIASKIIDPFVYMSPPVKLTFIPFSLNEIDEACCDINPNSYSFGKNFKEIKNMAIEAYLRRVQFEMAKSFNQDFLLYQSFLVKSRDIYYEIYNLFKAKFGEKLETPELNLSEVYLCRYKTVCWNLFESNCTLLLLNRERESSSNVNCEVLEKTLKMFKNIPKNYPESFESQISLYKYSSSLKIEYIMASIEEIISFEGIQDEHVLENKLKNLRYLIQLNISGSNSTQFEIFCRFKIVSLLSAKLDDSTNRNEHSAKVMKNLKRLGIEVNNCKCCLNANFNSCESENMKTSDLFRPNDFEEFCKNIENLLNWYYRYKPSFRRPKLEPSSLIVFDLRIDTRQSSWLVWKEVMHHFNSAIQNDLKIWIKNGFRYTCEPS